MEEESLNSKPYSLVSEVSEEVSTDSIADYKSGIYNLFVALYTHLIIDLGVDEAVKQATAFIDEISLSFKQITTKDESLE